MYSVFHYHGVWPRGGVGTTEMGPMGGMVPVGVGTTEQGPSTCMWASNRPLGPLKAKGTDGSFLVFSVAEAQGISRVR